MNPNLSEVEREYLICKRTFFKSEKVNELGIHDFISFLNNKMVLRTTNLLPVILI